MIDKDGDSIGTATLHQGASGVLIHVRVEGLAPVKPGLHLHNVVSCDPSTYFTSAEGHVGKVDGGHGLMNPDEPEPGDLPNIFVGQDGISEMEAFTALVSLKEGENNLLGADGSAFIIHGAADDHLTQPIGGAGVVRPDRGRLNIRPEVLHPSRESPSSCRGDGWVETCAPCCATLPHRAGVVACAG